MRIHAMTSDDIRPQCIQLLREIAQSPDPALASAFFSLVHNETFGVGGFVDKRFQLSKELVTQARTSNEGWQKMVAFLESTSWPCGFLRLHGLDDLHDRYLNRVERHVAMQSIWPYKVLQRARASKLGRMVPEKIIPKSLVKRALGLQQPDATIEAKPSPQTESQTASSASTHAVKH